MYATLKWIRFEAIMTAILPVNGISASKFHSFKQSPIS